MNISRIREGLDLHYYVFHDNNNNCISMFSFVCLSLSLFEKIVMLSLCSVGCFSVFPKYGFIIILYSFFSSSSFYHALDV